jgi:hypothetical protein
MNATLAPCPSCKRHVKVSEGSCPFCKHVLPSDMNAKGDVSIRGLSRAAAYALSASIVVVGCTGGPGDPPTENGTSGGTSGTSGGGSSGSTGGTSGGTSSGSTTSGGTSSGSSGTTSGEPNDGGNVQPPYGAPAYGAPAYGAVPVDGGS